MSARDTLIGELREHALVIGEVTLSSGQTAQYYVDARRAVLQPRGFLAAGELIAAKAVERGAEAVGGPVMAAIPLACAAIAVPGGSGKHVEVDISRQVMALVKDGEPEYVFHVSTGAAATPSDQGGYTFYRKDPGFNSLGMYYSVYYNRGEATHGYHSVPPYPASHGCIRNPIPDSIFIYNWIDLGDKMYVYR